MKKTFIVRIVDKITIVTVARIKARSFKEAKILAKGRGISSAILNQLSVYPTMDHNKLIYEPVEDTEIIFIPNKKED